MLLRIFGVSRSTIRYYQLKQQECALVVEKNVEVISAKLPIAEKDKRGTSGCGNTQTAR